MESYFNYYGPKVSDVEINFQINDLQELEDYQDNQSYNFESTKF